MENHHFQWVNPLFLWPFSSIFHSYVSLPGRVSYAASLVHLRGWRFFSDCCLALKDELPASGGVGPGGSAELSPKFNKSHTATTWQEEAALGGKGWWMTHGKTMGKPWETNGTIAWHCNFLFYGRMVEQNYELWLFVFLIHCNWKCVIFRTKMIQHAFKIDQNGTRLE